jgi:carbohydrate-selective porin OprB
VARFRFHNFRLAFPVVLMCYPDRRTEPVRLAESEKVVEIAHRVQLTPWSYFQPDIQYVIHPGGTGDIPDAVVIGAQMVFTF